MRYNDIIGYNYHANTVCRQWTSPSPYTIQSLSCNNNNYYSQTGGTPMAG